MVLKIEIEELINVGDQIEVKGFVECPQCGSVKGPSIDGRHTKEMKEQLGRGYNVVLREVVQRFADDIDEYTRLHLGKAKLEQGEEVG